MTYLMAALLAPMFISSVCVGLFLFPCLCIWVGPAGMALGFLPYFIGGQLDGPRYQLGD